MTTDSHRNDGLTHALGALADDEQHQCASAKLESVLLAEAGLIARARRRRVYTACGALAAAILAVLVSPSWRSPRTPTPAANAADSALLYMPAAPGEVTTEFFPLTYVNVPVSGGQAVRLELPQAALTSFGLEPDDASGTVLADVIVGDDGLARALRFVRPAQPVKEK